MLDMLPTSAMNNCPDHVGRNSKFFRYVDLPHSVSEFLADGKDLRLCQFGRMDGDAFVTCGKRVIASALFGHILHIVFGCAKKQVIRIYASAHVTCMAYMQAIWNRPIVDFPTKPMGREDFISEIDLAVPVGAFAALPKPASIGLDDVGPKAIFEWRVFEPKVMRDVSLWLSFDDAFASMVAGSYWCKLTTTTMAVAVGDFLLGIVGKGKLELHKKLTFLVPKPGALQAPLGYFYW